jgi:glyoxylase-like metal-dependent hydrolase (beta-lactamase superfamily II)
MLEPGSIQQFGDREWEVHAAPGHDPHSVLLFSAQDGILISGDALWETGFGVVFPELEGISAFSAVGDTLDLIEALAPKVVIPGHGRVFTDIQSALSVARRRLDGFMRDPSKHAGYAAKVLLKFKLLEVQKISRDELHTWTNTASYLGLLFAMYGNTRSKSEWTDKLIVELSTSGALKIDGEYLQNC